MYVIDLCTCVDDNFWLVAFANAIELVSKELNHLAAILHVYAGGLIFVK